MGILTDNYYKSTQEEEIGMLYRIKSQKFLQIIFEDFNTFKYFFWAAM